MKMNKKQVKIEDFMSKEVRYDQLSADKNSTTCGEST
jgi:hypothetical protein